MEYYFLGAYRPEFASVGFLPPVFRHSTENGYFFQQVSETDKIEEFQPFNPVQEPDTDNFFFLPSPQRYKKGDDPAFFFLVKEGVPLAGKLADIRSDLLVLMKDGSGPAFFKLEIAQSLRLYGYLNEQVLKTKGTNAAGDADLGCDPYILREDLISLEPKDFRRVTDVEEFYKTAENLAHAYGRGIEDLLVLEGKYAFCDHVCIHIKKDLFTKRPGLLNRLFCKNLPHIDGAEAVRLLAGVPGLYRDFEQAIDSEESGPYLLGQLNHEVMGLIKERHLRDPQMAEARIAKGEVGRQEAVEALSVLKRELRGLRDAVKKQQMQSAI